MLQFPYQEYCSIFYYSIERTMQKTVYNIVFYSLEEIYEKYKNLSVKFTAPIIICLCQISFLS